MYDPRSICVFDTIAICYDNVGATGYAVVNLNTGKTIKWFAYAGSADNEYNLNAITLKRVVEQERDFSLFQINPPSRLTVNSIDSILHNDNYKPAYLNQFAKGLSFSDAVLLNDSIIIGKQSFAKNDRNMYGVFNLNSNNLFTGIELPTLKGENNAKYYDSTHYAWTNSVMGGELVARPKSSGEFAFFSSKGSMIQIFSVNHESDMSVIYEKLYSLPTYEIVKHGNNTIGTKMLQDCRNGYNSIAVTHDKIYALYNGSSATTSNTMNLLANTILVYDWTGSPIEIIKLDHNFYSISIDSEKPEILYGLQSFDSVGIYKYNLKK